MEEPKRLSDLLRDAMDARGCNREKLAATTGVAEQFILALVDNTTHNAPPSTYARGYVNKIAKAIDVKPEELWGAYMREYNPRSSGALDLMPQNRFAIANVNKRLIIGVTIGALVAIYLAANSNRLMGVPQLTITAPKEETTTSNVAATTIKGVLENTKDTLTVNDVGVAVENDGFFEHELQLDPGINIVVVAAKRFLGRTTTATLQINYKPPEPTTSPPTHATSTSRSTFRSP